MMRYKAMLAFTHSGLPEKEDLDAVSESLEAQPGTAWAAVELVDVLNGRVRLTVGVDAPSRADAAVAGVAAFSRVLADMGWDALFCMRSELSVGLE